MLIFRIILVSALCFIASTANADTIGVAGATKSEARQNAIKRANSYCKKTFGEKHYADFSRLEVNQLPNNSWYAEGIYICTTR